MGESNAKGLNMIFSKTAIYGIYAICFLNRQKAEDVSSSTMVALALGIGEAHASKVLKRLSAAGVLSAVRGRRGGYRLARPMDEISVVEVLDALNPSHEESRLRAKNCRLGRAGLCSAHRGLIDLENRIREALAGETLGGLAGTVCTDVDAIQEVLLACRAKKAGKALAAL